MLYFSLSLKITYIVDLIFLSCTDLEQRAEFGLVVANADLRPQTSYPVYCICHHNSLQ